ncbi:MAG: deiodinase-like protein [Phycisphaerae bacterium]
MRQVGAMEKLYQTYKDIAKVYIVYISEAHASDDSWPVPYAKELGITEHKNFGERCAVAEKLVKDKKLTIPCLIDNMDNAAEKAYQGWPDRVFLIRKDGKLAVAAKRGPWGFKPALKAATKWLKEYKKTGKEPPLVIPDEEESDKTEAPIARKDKDPTQTDVDPISFSKLENKFGRAYRNSNYKKALEFAEKMHDMRPDDPRTTYNIACLHCLLGAKDQAYTWLEKSIRAGFADADHLSGDADFKTIRGEDRFRALLKQIRTKDTRVGRGEGSG